MRIAWLYALGLLLFCALSCSRSGFSDKAKIRIQEVRAERDQVSPGENYLQVDLLVENTGGDPVDLVDSGLRFRANQIDVSGEYSVSYDQTNPEQILPDDQAILILWVGIEQDATAGLVEIDGLINVRLADGSLVVVSGANQTDSWTVGAVEDQLDIDRVTTSRLQVNPGENQVPVSVHVSNPGTNPLTISGGTLHFSQESSDLDGDYQVTWEPANPDSVGAGAQEVLGFLVDVSAGATLGEVLIDAEVQARPASGDPISFSGAQQTATWEVVEAGDVQIDWVRTDTLQVEPGQSGLLIQMQVSSQGSDDVGLQAPWLRFLAGGTDPVIEEYTVSEQPGNPDQLLAGQTEVLDFSVTVHEDATTGLIVIDGNIQVVLPDQTVVDLLGAAETDSWVVIDAGQVDITLVNAQDDEVAPGQINREVAITLVNPTGEPVQVVSYDLKFTIGPIDVQNDYQVTPSAGNPAQIPAGSQIELDSSVDVAQAASPGTVTIDADVVVRYADDSEETIEGAQVTDSWLVEQPPADLIVTTADDEDDTGGVPTLEAAGGAADLSLREAMLIAMAGGEPAIIRFDGSVFPESAPVEIDMQRPLGGLPSVTLAGMQIDGTGAGVSIYGYDIDAEGFEVLADDFSLIHIELRDFRGFTNRGIHAHFVNRVRISECTFDDCGGMSYSQVRLRGGSDHVVENCVFRDGSGTGLSLADQPDNVLISGNQFLASYGYGIYLSGFSHQVSGNLIQSSGYYGVKCEGTVGIVLDDNEFLGNGHGVGGYTDGLSFTGQNSNASVTACLFRGSHRHAIYLTSVSSSYLAFSQCTFEGNGDLPIGLTQDSNQGVQPPVVTSVDGLEVSGTSNVEGGLVEVYLEDPATFFSYLGSATVTGGNWSFTLGEAQTTIRATVTTPQGSTSEFSGP